jgi:N-acetylmuramoyl-L-alanine amidase
MRLVLALFVCLCAPALAAATAAARPDLAIDAVRAGLRADGTTRVVLDLSAPAPAFAARAEGARVLLDLPPFVWREGAPRLAGTLRAVRPGNRPGGARVTMDTAAPVAVAAAFALPPQGTKPHRLVLDLAPAQEATPQAVAGPPPPPPRPKPLRIVLDPGHGGRDPGAISGKVQEKAITLALAKELARQLRADGRYQVYLTREDDRALSLADRVTFARTKKADLFLSIHADSIGKPAVRGASVYTLSETASDAQTAKLAVRENRADILAGLDLTHEDPQVTTILIDLAQRDSLNKAGFLAEALVRVLSERGVTILENPHRYAGFAVLKAPDIPSVLIEAGFLSNRAEAQALADPGHRRKIAAAIKRGVDAYAARIVRTAQAR